jgi:hypothetical protein
MNAKIFLFGLVAVIWLPASLAMAGPRGSSGTASGARTSGAGFSGARMSAGPMSQRMSAGSTSVGRFSTASAGTPRTFTGTTSRWQSGTGNYRAGSVGTNHWSGNNNNNHHHRHHHRSSFVFIGDFGYPFGYPYWWYDDFYPYGYNYDPAVYEDAAAYGGSMVAQVQTRLARAGYYRGAIDGVVGPETRRAIRAYQRSNGLRADGAISKPLIASMGLG